MVYLLKMVIFHGYVKSDVDHLETGWNPLAFHGSRQTVMRTIQSCVCPIYVERGSRNRPEIRTSAVYLRHFHPESYCKCCWRCWTKTNNVGLSFTTTLFTFLISFKARVTAVKNDFSNEIQVISVCWYISKLTPKGPKGLARRTVHFFREWVQLRGPNEFETQLALLTSQSRDQLLPTSLRRLIHWYHWFTLRPTSSRSVHNCIPNCFSWHTSVLYLGSHVALIWVYTGFWLHSGEGERDAWRTLMGCAVERWP